MSTDQRESADTNNIAGSAASLDLLLRSCSSITSKSLSYRPLTGRSRRTGKENTGSSEKDSSAMLAAQIRLRRSRYQSKTNSIENPIQLQQDILDETLRLQQEHLLLKRMTLSHAALPKATDDKDRAWIRQEAARARARKVEFALQQHRTLDALLSKVRSLELECHRQRQENRAIYRQLVDRKKQWDESKKDNSAMGRQDENQKNQSRLAKENNILRCLLKDLVAGSGVEWHSDARLRRILALSDDD